jgi:hypothetical protein
MMAVTLRQLSAPTTQSLLGERLGILLVSEHTIIQIKKFVVFKYWFEKEGAANSASPR